MDELNAVDAQQPGQSLSGKKLFQWAIQLITQPKTFFASMAKTGGYKTPILYALFWLFTAGVIDFVINLIRPLPILQEPLGRVGQIIWVVLGPGMVLGIGFIVTGIIFVIWHLMGSKESFETAFRCWAFITPLSVISSILSLVPFLGLIVMAFSFYLLITASIHVHGISGARSWTVWGILFAGLILLGILGVAAQQTLQKRGLGAGEPTGLPSFSLNTENIAEPEK